MAYEKKLRRNAIEGWTAKQWAWEFLRRNPIYRKSYYETRALSKEELISLSAVKECGADALPPLLHLTAKWFEFSYPDAPTYRDASLAAFLDRRRSYSAPPGKLHVSIHPRFDLSNYSLSKWIDPDISPLPLEMHRFIGLVTLEISTRYRRRNEAEEIEAVEFMRHASSPERLEELENFEIALDAMRAEIELTYPLSEVQDAEEEPERTQFQNEMMAWHDASSVGNWKFTHRPKKSSEFDLTETYVPKLSKLVEGHSNDVERKKPTDVLLRIDLDFPLQPQLDAFNEAIRKYQSDLVESGHCPSFPKIVDKGGIYADYLQILDLLADGRDATEIAVQLRGVERKSHVKLIGGKPTALNYSLDIDGAEIDAKSAATRDIRKQIQRATDLRDTGYLGLAFLE